MSILTICYMKLQTQQTSIVVTLWRWRKDLTGFGWSSLKGEQTPNHAPAHTQNSNHILGAIFFFLEFQINYTSSTVRQIQKKTSIFFHSFIFFFSLLKKQLIWNRFTSILLEVVLHFNDLCVFFLFCTIFSIVSINSNLIRVVTHFHLTI